MPSTKTFSSFACLLAVPLFLASACSGAQSAAGPRDPATADFVRRMGLGWNLGNTLEACGDWIKGSEVRDFETAWGNPETTREMIQAIREAGFGSVRIPVAWSNLVGNNHKIHGPLMDRVREVVGYVLDSGMVAVVNIHWDGGWWKNFPTDYDGCMKRYTSYWSQISAEFKDYPVQLVFESLNEELAFDDLWNHYEGKQTSGKERAFEIANAINQAFVDVVRASGGLNGQRHLLIASYTTNIDLALDPLYRMPKDPAGRTMLSVHYYTPPQFAILSEDASWGKARPTWGTDEDLDEMKNNFDKIQEGYAKRGIPVIVGEYGTPTKNKDPQSVRDFILKGGDEMLKRGLCPMIWDAGQYFDRRNLAFRDPEMAKGLKALALKYKVN